MSTTERTAPKITANNLTPFCPTHPGAILGDELEYLGISARDAAEQMGISAQTVEELLAERQPLTPELALLFEAFLGVPSDAMLRLQNKYDIEMARKNSGFMEKLKGIKKIAAVL